MAGSGRGDDFASQVAATRGIAKIEPAARQAREVGPAEWTSQGNPNRR